MHQLVEQIVDSPVADMYLTLSYILFSVMHIVFPVPTAAPTTTTAPTIEHNDDANHVKGNGNSGNNDHSNNPEQQHQSVAILAHVCH